MINHIYNKLRIFSRMFALFLFVFLTGCFEYEETIHFEKPFEGYIDISYTVPLKKNTNESLIRFLPTTRKEVEKKVNQGIISKNLEIQDFRFVKLDVDPEQETIFKRRGNVYYRVSFTDLAALDSVLIGTLKVKQKGKTLRVKREFNSLHMDENEEITPGEKKILAESKRLLADGFIKFRVEYPRYSQCYSTKGLLSLGNLEYTLPLTETLEGGDKIAWEYILTILY